MHTSSKRRWSRTKVHLVQHLGSLGDEGILLSCCLLQADGIERPTALEPGRAHSNQDYYPSIDLASINVSNPSLNPSEQMVKLHLGNS